MGMIKKSALEIYRTFKQEIAKERIYDDTRGSSLLFEARTGVLRTKTYRAKYEGDHFTADQFEPILLRKFGTKKLKRDAAPTIFSQEHLQTSECNDSARSSCGLDLLLTAAALVDEAKETHCPSATNVLLTPAAVDGYGANSDATQAGFTRGVLQIHNILLRSMVTLPLIQHHRIFQKMHLQVPNVTHCQLVQQLVQQAPVQVVGMLIKQ
ncbi:hypothetical protein HPB51_014053 [Rhipicephalus microplus]|uniref:Uncharacterized protein n=1 Tax=Rhipicephalus microplus TaxID=6941 RepID=A0A9J6EAE0_RHIMP|nr:hypothetical protein HPB51_014053 [Rhipicephalus microplus]